MALEQSAQLEVLDALKAADVGDRVRQAAETVYQALIEAELTETIGAALHERTEHRSQPVEYRRVNLVQDPPRRLPWTRPARTAPADPGAPQDR